MNNYRLPKMPEMPHWRDWLKEYFLENLAELDRIAREVGVNSQTVLRWINGASVLPLYRIPQLLQALPVPQKDIFAELLERENLLPELSGRGVPYEIDTFFFKLILEMRAMVPVWLVFQTICSAVLSHALGLLDPKGVGLAIRVIQCMPPSHDGKIRSLRATLGQGVLGRNTSQESQSFFLGGESLAGYAVKACYPKSEQSLASNALLFPMFQHRPFVSTLATPILCTQRIAGCLLVSSTQADYFLSST